jgi:IS5 family transposase
VLQKTISAMRAETWEAINRTLLASARQEKLEDGRVVRLDSTVTAALMHEPSDSSLLWDAVRVMVRLLQEADTLTGGPGRGWRNHCRAAKKRWRAIEFTRGRPQRVQLYRELIKITRATLDDLRRAAARLASNPAAEFWRAKVRHYQPLVEQIIAQTERRVLTGGISCLKRAYGLARCTWRGLAHFEAYVWSSVVAYNLALLARLRPA